MRSKHTSRERIVNTVKADRVDRINDFGAILFRPMAFERKLALLNVRVQVKVLDGHTALDRAHHKSFLVREYANAARLVFQRRFTPRHVMVHLTEIPNQHPSIGCGHHQFLIDGIHRIDFAIVLFVRANAFLLSRVPHLHRFVPATS